MCIRDSRYSEHLKALTNNNIHSAFATHIHTENHSYINIDINLEILHYIPKGQKLTKIRGCEFEEEYRAQV